MTSPARLTASLRETHASLASLRSLVPHREALAPGVSAVPAGWHIEHALLSIDRMIASLRSSDPDAYRWRFDPKRSFVIWLGFMPRGAAESPASVRPTPGTTAEDLLAHSHRTEAQLDSILQLPEGSWAPSLGGMRRDAAARFLDIHTRHHLAIANDIVRAAR